MNTDLVEVRKTQKQISAYDPRLTKHAHGKSYAIINNTKDGGVLNHIVDAPNERDTTPNEDRARMRYNLALQMKGQWHQTEYPVDDLEIVEVLPAGH